MKVKKANIPIYLGHLHIVITKDFYRACKKLKVDLHGCDVNEWGAFCNRYTDKKGVLHYRVFLKPKASHTIIAHESVHLVNMIFDDRHMKLDLLNDEPQAYLMGWVIGEIYRAIKK